MNFAGKYIFTIPTPSGGRENTLLLRNYYTGDLHGTLLDDQGSIHLAQKIVADGDRLSFTAQCGPNNINFAFTVAENSFSGTAEVLLKEGDPVISQINGIKTEITPEDDGTQKIEMKRKALILYATITKNTERVAVWFKETFEHYGMEVNMIRVTNGKRWREGIEDKLCLDDYDVVCLGSPIIGGSPMKCILTHFSAGAASALEDNVAKNAENGFGFNAGGAGGFAEGQVKSGPGMPPPPPAGGPGGPPDMIKWRRESVMRYPGGPHKPGMYRPIGIAFTTYGGGFCGPRECMPVLELLKLYLEDKGAKVIGLFACPGKEFGPAGLDDGEPPVQIHEQPVYYKDADGNYHAGGFFFHTSNNNNPAPRHEAQARAFIASIVEDHLLTWDGKRRDPESEYISIV